MEFDTRAIHQIRLALIEACINAFEHSGSEDPNVYINFVVQEDRLLIIVRDFGAAYGLTPGRYRARHYSTTGKTAEINNGQ